MIETLGSRLKQLRNSKHLRQDQVAELLGVNKAAISYYENDTRQPSYSTLIRIASVFNVSTDYLLGVKQHDALNLSGLTTADLVYIEETVELLSEKNRRLEEYENRLSTLMKGTPEK